MSNPLAIATVTAVLEVRLQTMFDNLDNLSGVDVTAGLPPRAAELGVFINLVQVLPNTQLNNQSLPFRRSDGSGANRPTAALDLVYLLSFGGADAAWERERVMGFVVNELNVRPVLTAEEIEDYAATQTSNDPLFGTDLAESPFGVRFTPMSLDLETLSRIWGMFGLDFYIPSLAYRASVVSIDAELEVSSALPVGGRGLMAVPFSPPVITSAVSEARDYAVVLEGEVLVLSGRNLLGDTTALRIDEEEVEPDSVTSTALRYTVTGFTPGVKLVRVVHYVDLDDGSSDPLRPGPVSNAVAVVLAPSIAANPSEAAATTDEDGADALEIRLDVTPVPEADQELALLLNLVGGGEALRCTEWSMDGDQVVFITPELEAGDYLMRLLVDGAESLLSTDGDGVYDGPVVTVT